MANFTERVEYKLEIIPPYSVIQCRKAVIVDKDGVEIGRTYHRHTVAPGADLTSECEEVQKVAKALWTSALISEYKNYIDSSLP